MEMRRRGVRLRRGCCKMGYQNSDRSFHLLLDTLTDIKEKQVGADPTLTDIGERQVGARRLRTTLASPFLPIGMCPFPSLSSKSEAVSVLSSVLSEERTKNNTIYK